jgi:hypothetical protein
MGIYQGSLVRYGNKRDTFLGRIIAGNETWISYREPESKWQSMEGNYRQVTSKNKFKSQPSARKLTSTVFGLTRPSTGTTDKAHYSEMPTYRLKPSI